LVVLRVALLQVHGALAASHTAPPSAPSVTDLLCLMKQAAQKPILWYLTLCGFLVSGSWATSAYEVGMNHTANFDG
jgi:hypothetical protein